MNQVITHHTEKSEIERLNNWLDGKNPQSILRWVNATFPTEKIGLGTGFGPSGVVLIDMAIKINRDIPIFYLDTEVLFPETYELKDRIEKTYGIQLIRYTTDISMEKQAELYGDKLWERDPDMCCGIRKVLPLKLALRNYDVWITGVRRDQNIFRASADIANWESRFNIMKVNPLAAWTKEDVWKYIKEHKIPYNPLHDTGYTSIGCTYCTTRVKNGEHERAGRWRGSEKTECGLHFQVEYNRFLNPKEKDNDKSPQNPVAESSEQSLGKKSAVVS